MHGMKSNLYEHGVCRHEIGSPAHDRRGLRHWHLQCLNDTHTHLSTQKHSLHKTKQLREVHVQLPEATGVTGLKQQLLRN